MGKIYRQLTKTRYGFCLSTKKAIQGHQSAKGKFNPDELSNQNYRTDNIPSTLGAPEQREPAHTSAGMKNNTATV